MNNPAVRDATLLILRGVLGIIFVAHGYQKFFLNGLTETTGSFSAMGVPQPKLSATLAAVTELGAGALLVVGLLSTVVASILALVMLGAIYFVHLGQGFFVQDGGLEFPLVLLAGLLVVIVFGGGRASVDGLLTRAEV